MKFAIALLGLTTAAWAGNITFPSNQSGQLVWGYDPAGTRIEFQANMTMNVEQGIDAVNCGMCFGQITISVPGHSFGELLVDAYAHPPGGPWTDMAEVTTTQAGVGQKVFWGTGGGPDYRAVSGQGIESVEILDVYQPFQALRDITLAGISGEPADPTPEPGTWWLLGSGLLLGLGWSRQWR